MCWSLFQIPWVLLPGSIRSSLCSDGSWTISRYSLNILISFNVVSFARGSVRPLVTAYTTIMLLGTVCSLIASVICLAWPGIHIFRVFVTYAVPYALFLGSLMVFPPTAVPLLCLSPSVIGTRMRMLWGSAALAYLLGTLITAAISDTSNGHSLKLRLFSGVTPLIRTLSLLPLWAPIRKKQQNTEVSVTPEKA